MVAGRIVTADDGQPMRFSLVELVRLDSVRPARVLLTDSAGSFVFNGVAAGFYRLRIDRIGYEPEPAQPFQVAPGQALDLALRSDPHPVQLAAITVPSVPCYAGDELEQETALATLWREARKAGEARRLFDASHAYTVDVNEQLTLQRQGRRNVYSSRRRTVTSTPAVAAVLADSAAQLGYGARVDAGFLLAAPELPELLGPGFLRTHCIGLLADRGKDHRILFRPLREDTAHVDLSGTIVLDGGFQVKRVELEYRRGPYSFAHGTVEYGDVGSLGTQLRFARWLRIDASGGALENGREGEMSLALTRSPSALPAGFPRARLHGIARMTGYRDFVRDTTRR